MPHLPRFIAENYVYHTISATRKRLPTLAEPGNAEDVIEALRFVQAEGRAYVLAYAVLPDHMHLLIAPRDGNSLPDLMKAIKNFSARRINKRAGLLGPVWQQSYFDRVIRTETQLFATIDYIHRNPVEAGLSATSNAYLFSSAHPESHVDIDAFFAEQSS
ncbi:MAG: transposase [Dehalococcoidia bacterium]